MLRNLLFRKQRRIEAMFSEYLDQWEECLDLFLQAMGRYLDHGFGDEFLALVHTTHKRESRADDLRRAIEYEMYARALLPESRGDILGSLEALDRIPNRAESILFQLSADRVAVPGELRAPFATLLAFTGEATALLIRMARGMFAWDPDLLSAVRAIDDKESECDLLGRALITRIVESPTLEGLTKHSLKELVDKIGDLSDLAENIADRLMIINLKRRV